MASGVRVAVVGVTGAVGQTTLKILEERKFPVRDLRVFASERSAGKTVTFRGETLRVEKVGPEAFKGVEIALFSAGSAQSREFAPLAVKAGAVVVDKSSAFRMDPAVPLVVPEINAHAVKGACGHRGLPELHQHRHRHAAQAAARRRAAPARDRHQLPGGVGSGRERGGGASHADPRVGARRGHRPAVLRPSDRLQRDPAHRQVRRQRLYRRGDEAGQRAAQDPRAPRPARLAHHGARAGLHRPLGGGERGDGGARWAWRARGRSSPASRASSSGTSPAEQRYPMPVHVEGQDDCFVGRVRQDLTRRTGSTSGWWAISSARARR